MTETQARVEDNVAPWALDLVGFVLVGRGLINLAIPFDQLILLSATTQTLLYVISIIAGVGVLMRTKWGLRLGIFASFFFFILEGDYNIAERYFGRMLSFFILAGLWKTRSMLTRGGKNATLFSTAVILLLLGVITYEATQPNEEDLFYHKYLPLAIEKRDYTICDNLKNLHLRSECYRLTSFEIKNPLICKIISDEDEKKSCYDDYKTFYGKNAAFCSSITDEEVKQRICGA